MTSRRIPILLALVGLSLLVSCADPVPDDYVPELVVEGFAIAGQPLSNIRIFATQPLSDTFSLEKAMIRDAEVLLTENGTPLPVQYVSGDRGGYYEVADPSFRVKEESTYELEVRAIGKVARATATTPKAFSWIVPPKSIMQYPGRANETKFFDSLRVSWVGQEGIGRYVVGIECLDTVNYGTYLTPPTEDTNRRIREEEIDDGSLISSERMRYGFSFVSNTPVVWIAFKWFGPHRIHIYTGDAAFQAWFSMVGFGRRSSYDYRLSNVEGGLGVFAGATEITAPIFLLKDTP